jgi:hypothetical protein
MADLSVQQKNIISEYRKSHPESAKISDTQILSIMSKDKNIHLSQAEKNSVFAGKTKTTKTNNFQQNTEKTIELSSGRKIVIKDRKSHYYSADGVELNKKYFEQKEGKIEIKPSGRYSVTKNGKTKYYALNGTELKESYFKQVESSDVKFVSKNGKTYNVNKTLEKRIDLVSSKLEQAEKENGYIGKAWSGFKNLTGIGASSDKVREQQKEEQKLLAQFNSNPQTRSTTFKKMTGVEYTQENLEKFIKGEIKLKSEQALNSYKEGQEEVVDVTSDIASGIVSYSAAAIAIGAGVAAAPFTAGASLGGVVVGIGIAAGAGATTKVLIKSSDALVGGREYTLKDTAKDIVVGGVGGALAPITMGVGGAVSNTTVKVAPKVIANTARYSVEGGMFGAVDGGTRTAIEGELLKRLQLQLAKEL